MRLYILGLLVCFSFNAYADFLVGTVVKVTDGDSITVLSNNVEHRVRLSGIDAPEKGQPFSDVSRKALADVVAGKSVTIDYNKRDRYGRIIGKVLIGGIDVNLEQVKKGLAWHYKEYEREQDVEDRSIYAQEEYLAQRDRVGLWADMEPVAPWDYRKR